MRGDLGRDNPAVTASGVRHHTVRAAAAFRPHARWACLFPFLINPVPEVPARVPHGGRARVRRRVPGRIGAVTGPANFFTATGAVCPDLCLPRFLHVGQCRPRGCGREGAAATRQAADPLTTSRQRSDTISPQHPGRGELDLRRRIPAGQRLDLGGGDQRAVLVAQQVFQQHLEAERQPRRACDPVEPDDLIRGVIDGERGRRRRSYCSSISVPGWRTPQKSRPRSRLSCRTRPTRGRCPAILRAARAGQGWRARRRLRPASPLPPRSPPMISSGLFPV